MSSVPLWAGSATAQQGRFLKSVKARPNLHIITDAHTTSVQVEAGRATGVTFFKGGRHGLEQQIRPAVR